jgi:hypothetical protein
LESIVVRALESSDVDNADTFWYHAPISSSDLIVLCELIPLNRRGIPCSTLTPLVYTALMALKALTRSSSRSALI